MHHGDEDGFMSDGFSDILRINPTIWIDSDIDYLRPKLFKKLAGVKDSRMLDLGCDDMIPSFLESKEDALNGMIVGFTAAAGKDNLLREAVEEFRHLLARMLNGLLSWSSRPVLTRGIAKVLREEWFHDLCHFGGNRRAGIEIKINVLGNHVLAPDEL
jgi:hypothetical protein